MCGLVCVRHRARKATWPAGVLSCMRCSNVVRLNGSADYSVGEATKQREISGFIKPRTGQAHKSKENKKDAEEMTKMKGDTASLEDCEEAKPKRNQYQSRKAQL